MIYKCPQCGVEMKPIFCECRFVDGLHSGYDQTGKMICFRCGLPLSKEMENTMTTMRKEN